MISILVPVYNYNCTELICALHEQGLAIKRNPEFPDFDFEIILAEDGSEDIETCHANKTLMHEIGQVYVQNRNNIGRARIRNYLLSLARFPHCLLIDCDALVCTPDFLLQYWNSRNRADVICGRIRTPKICPPGCELRHKYETQAEKKRSMEYKAMHPYHHFSTFNVLFNNYVFKTLRFDERCTEYGYEDALLGLKLEQEGYSVMHAEIPLIHNGMDKNAEFIKKTETSLRVLRRLGEPMQSFSKISRIERTLCKLHLIPLTYYLLRKWRDSLLSNLLSNHPSLVSFQLYKLFYYIETRKIQQTPTL